jgi:hypothetical protein
MKPIAIMPDFNLARERIEVNAGVIESALEFAEHLGMLRRAFAGRRAGG